MKVVIDASAAGALLLPEPEFPMERFFKKLKEGSELHIPALFWWELANILVQAVRRKRIEGRQVSEGLRLMSTLPFQPAEAVDPATAEALAEEAMTWGLSSYDAAYVSLARRMSLPLLSLDRAMLRAASKAGVKAARL